MTHAHLPEGFLPPSTTDRLVEASTSGSSSTTAPTPTTSVQPALVHLGRPRGPDAGSRAAPRLGRDLQGAIDTELGILKTGKEADVFLVERADPHRPDEGVVMAAKRYRDTDHRTFHRAAAYTEGRSMKRSRDNRALKRKSHVGPAWWRPASGPSPSGGRCDASGSSGCRSPTRSRSTGPRS